MPAIDRSNDDCRYNGFPELAARKGFAAMAAPENWTKWGYDNNDGDVCCADQVSMEES